MLGAFMKLRFLAPLLALFGTSMSATAQGPDFSGVDSREKVQALFKEGKLEKAYLFPLELGGQDVEANIVYLPIGLGDMKKKLDGTVKKFADDGLITKLTVEPVYKGKSFIPSKIIMKGSNPDRKGTFEPTLEVW
jgi:hypothetical protein